MYHGSGAVEIIASKQPVDTAAYRSVGLSVLNNNGISPFPFSFLLSYRLSFVFHREQEVCWEKLDIDGLEFAGYRRKLCSRLRLVSLGSRMMRFDWQRILLFFGFIVCLSLPLFIRPSVHPLVYFNLSNT